MPERKRPVFGVMSLVLMLGLGVAGVLVTMYGPPPIPARDGEDLAVAIGAVSNIIATIAAIVTVSVTAIILAGISFLRRERPWPAGIAMCLALSSLVIVVTAIFAL